MSPYDLSACAYVLLLLILPSLLALSALCTFFLLPSWPTFPSLIVLPLLLDHIFACVFVFSFEIQEKTFNASLAVSWLFCLR